MAARLQVHFGGTPDTRIGLDDPSSSVAGDILKIPARAWHSRAPDWIPFCRGGARSGGGRILRSTVGDLAASGLPLPLAVSGTQADYISSTPFPFTAWVAIAPRAALPKGKVSRSFPSSPPPPRREQHRSPLIVSSGRVVSQRPAALTLNPCPPTLARFCEYISWKVETVPSMAVLVTEAR